MTAPLTEEERRDLLVRTGEALYGFHWHIAIASHLNVDTRTVQRWGTGERGFSARVLRKLIDHCDERIAEIEQMRDTLARALE